MREYFCAFHSMTSAMRKLSDAEVGRLFRGLLHYSETGEQPTNLQGREELLFDVFSQQIDRERERYNDICARNKANRIANDKTTRDDSSPLVTTRHHSSQEKEKDKDEEKEKRKDEEKDKRNDNISRVFGLLNERTGKHFRAVGQSRAHVNARFAEGYTLEDFETVIDKKCAEWLGTDMERYLRPETLFGSKFDGYLNEPIKRQRPKDTGWDFEDLIGPVVREKDRVYVEPEQEGGFPF